MTIARREQFRPDITPFYHCITRCVRRAFLCGEHPDTGNDVSHRRGWIERHLLLLSEVFCIDIAGYAVMSNHYHVVLHINQKQASNLSDKQVITRWLTLYKGPALIQRYAKAEELTQDEADSIVEIASLWRKELTNISRFIGHLNQTIARRANREDDCKGRFWESRFKMQAILDVNALLRTLCYVDLNPVRAGIARTPESSAHTSVKRRLKSVKNGLMGFARSGVKRRSSQFSTDTLPISFGDYLELLAYAGRQYWQDHRMSIDSVHPAILDRLGYKAKKWTEFQRHSAVRQPRALGSRESIERYCQAIGQKWIWNSSVC